MINYHKDFLNLLKSATDYDCYYELFCSNKKLPIVSYCETLNVEIEGTISNEASYSKIGFLVKIWDTDLGNCLEQASKIDAVLRQHGFIRYGNSDEVITEDGVVIKFINYKTIGYETK